VGILLVKCTGVFETVRGARRFRNGADVVGFSSEGAPMSGVHLHAGRFTGREVVRVLLGFILLTAAELKAYQPAARRGGPLF